MPESAVKDRVYTLSSARPITLKCILGGAGNLLSIALLFGLRSLNLFVEGVRKK